MTNKRLKLYTEFLTENLKSWHKFPLGNTPQLQKNCSVWHMNTWGCAWKVEKMFVWPAAAERRKASQSLANGKSVLRARASLYTLTVSLIFAAEVSHIFPYLSFMFSRLPTQSGLINILKATLWLQWRDATWPTIGTVSRARQHQLPMKRWEPGRKKAKRHATSQSIKNTWWEYMEIALLKLQSSHKLVREGMVLDAHGWRLQCNGYSRIHSFLLWGFSAQNQNRTCWCSPIPITIKNRIECFTISELKSS